MTKLDRNLKLCAVAVLIAATAAVGLANRGHARRAPDTTDRHFAAHPTRPVSFTASLDRTRVLRGSDGQVRMELVMGGEPREADRARVPTDLVVVLDRSGSMGGEKLRYARAAIGQLVAELAPDDRFALVSYADGAALRIPLSRAVDASRDAWLRTVSGIAAQGSTNLSAGLDLALRAVSEARVVERVPRVILISDGLANRGDASLEGLVGRARRAARGEYVLSTVGVGTDFNETLMTALADAGTGNYYYLESAHNLALVFGAEFDAARATVATGLALRIEPRPGVRVVSAAGYPLERTDGAVVIRPGALFAGQERRIWVALAAPSDALGEHALGRFSLSYTTDGARREVRFEKEPSVACVADRERFLGGLDADRWGRSVAEDQYGGMQSEVSRYLRSGRREEAQAAIDRFVRENEALNAEVASPAVAEQLLRARELKTEVDEAFTGADAPARRNRLSKQKSLESQSRRRPGAYAVDPESLVEPGGAR